MTNDIITKPICQQPTNISGIVDAFECIGRHRTASGTTSPETTIDLVERLQRNLMRRAGISAAQARLFFTRVLEHCPPPGATPDAVRADLDQEMLGILLNPQTRQPAYSIAPTGIAGIDFLRMNGVWALREAGPWERDEDGGPRYLEAAPVSSAAELVVIPHTFHRVDTITTADYTIESIKRLLDLR